MITIYVLILPQRMRDSLEQEYAEVHIQNVRQYALLSIAQDLRSSPRSKEENRACGRLLAPQYVRPSGVQYHEALQLASSMRQYPISWERSWQIKAGKRRLLVDNMGS